MARKWIDKRIAELDPETDYDEIWKLSTAYRPNDFTMNLVYTLTVPHFFVRELDVLPLIDGGKGKILHKGLQRADDTSWKMQVWWHYGSGHEKTKSNVESINRLHAHYAKTFPDSFNRNEAYVYTLCYEAAGMHRLLQRVGLPGISENEQRAGVKYWAKMAPLFRIIGSDAPITGFPDSFDGIMAYMDRHEAEDVPVHAYGPTAVNAVIRQFADRYFPKVLHPLVTSWITSLYPEHLIKAYGLKKPSAPAVRTYRALTALFFAFGDKVMPDPTDTFTERRQAAKAERRAITVTPAAVSVRETGAETLSVANCPHLQKMAGFSSEIADKVAAKS